MKEEIRLGNEALARHDLETAAQYFRQVLATDSTDLQKRIATNRLRDIQAQRIRAEAPPPSPALPRPRTRRKATDRTQSEPEATHHFVRPPDQPVVVIKRH
jgi:hypothetical protein